jgi:hypothetical protein
VLENIEGRLAPTGCPSPGHRFSITFRSTVRLETIRLLVDLVAASSGSKPDVDLIESKRFPHASRRCRFCAHCLVSLHLALKSYLPLLSLTSRYGTLPALAEPAFEASKIEIPRIESNTPAP